MQFSQFTADVTLASSNTRVDATMMTFSLDSIRYHQLVNYITIPHLLGTLHSWRGKPEAEVTFRCCEKALHFEECVRSRPFCFQSSGPLIFLSHDCKCTWNIIKHWVDLHVSHSNSIYYLHLFAMIHARNIPIGSIFTYYIYLIDFYGECR